MTRRHDQTFLKHLADPALRMRAIRRWQRHRRYQQTTAVLFSVAALSLALLEAHHAAIVGVVLAAGINFVLLASIDIKIKLAMVEDRPPY